MFQIMFLIFYRHYKKIVFIDIIQQQEDLLEQVNLLNLALVVMQ